MLQYVNIVAHIDIVHIDIVAHIAGLWSFRTDWHRWKLSSAHQTSRPGFIAGGEPFFLWEPDPDAVRIC